MRIKHIILDLDETLVHAVPFKELAAAGRAPFGDFKYHVFDQYVIFERPHLAEFLRALSAQYTISVWTAASESYAHFIVDNILAPLVSRPIPVVLHSAHCQKSRALTGILKHLDILYEAPPGAPKYKRGDTILVDDNPGVLAQNSMVIQIAPFLLKRGDDELARVAEKIARIK